MGEKVLVAGKWSPLLTMFLLKIPGTTFVTSAPLLTVMNKMTRTINIFIFMKFYTMFTQYTPCILCCSFDVMFQLSVSSNGFTFCYYQIFSGMCLDGLDGC